MLVIFATIKKLDKIIKANVRERDSVSVLAKTSYILRQSERVRSCRSHCRRKNGTSFEAESAKAR